MEEITQEMIAEWKSKYGEIYQVNLGGQAFVYRPLKRVEYKQIIGTAEANRSFSEEQIVQKCLIHPKADAATLASEKAGTISTLTDLIMVASNFGVMEEPIKL
ncbi:hypothetical protein DRQ25_11650 [Candidatus Fermentibacteria bacterium]|nr:MAG: hypothetical protein DRQ25_11650 [Candidatus Fermentibacteria bacterium]